MPILCPNFLLILLAFSLLDHPITAISQHPNSFIYKYCSTQKLHEDPDGVFTTTMHGLLADLLSRSHQSTSYKTVAFPAGYETDHHPTVTPLWGRYQCRPDLTSLQCHSCVKSIPNISSNSWCPNSVSARFQLSGCLLQYESDGGEIEEPDLSHTSCGEVFPAVLEDAGFLETRAAVFEAVENGVVDNPNGFSSVEYRGFHAVAQCEVGLEWCHCAECVGRAVAIAEEACSASVDGEVYLDSCYVRFENRPDGAGGYSYQDEDHGGGDGGGKTAKIAAIAVGVVAALAVALLFVRRSLKKGDDY